MMRARLLVALAAAVTLSACGGSGPTDRQLIASIVKREGVRPASLCDHLTQSLLSRLGGRRRCVIEAASAAPDPTTHATAIRIHRNTATAVVVNRNGRRTISLIKHKGVWELAAVH
jgi:hypothetical protein